MESHCAQYLRKGPAIAPPRPQQYRRVLDVTQEGLHPKVYEPGVIDKICQLRVIDNEANVEVHITSAKSQKKIDFNFALKRGIVMAGQGDLCRFEVKLMGLKATLDTENFESGIREIFGISESHAVTVIPWTDHSTRAN